MKRTILRGLYNFTGNMGWLFVELANVRPFGYFEWPYRIGNWFYNRHYDIALRHRFWKLNPAWTKDNQEPRYIDAP